MMDYTLPAIDDESCGLSEAEKLNIDKVYQIEGDGTNKISTLANISDGGWLSSTSIFYNKESGEKDPFPVLQNNLIEIISRTR